MNTIFIFEQDGIECTFTHITKGWYSVSTTKIFRSHSARPKEVANKWGNFRIGDIMKMISFTKKIKIESLEIDKIDYEMHLKGEYKCQD